jgi:dipeptidyl aminopeptidase/acylaminoacyl peptidase
MALMTTAKNPTLFRAVGAFVPITDMLSWHEFNDAKDSYRPHIEACIGGSPSEVGKNAYLERSPISYINELSKANIKLFHGKFDTTVPYTQSVELFRLITEKDAKSRVFLDLFDGGHEIDMDSAFKWFLSQVEDKNLTKVTG